MAVALNDKMMKIAQATGYKDFRSLRFLHNLVKLVDPDCVLELGTGYGASAIYMASALRNGGMVVSVDDYKFMKYTGRPRDMILGHIGGCGDLVNKIVLVEGSTYCTAELLVGFPLKPEIVFMDAAHGYEGIKKEYQSITPLLPKEHVVVLDDLLSPVALFVPDLLKQYKFCLTVKDFHQGVAVACTSYGYLTKVNEAIREAYA